MGHVFQFIKEQALEPLFWLFLIGFYLAQAGTVGLGQPQEVLYIDSARAFATGADSLMLLINDTVAPALAPLTIWLITLSVKVFGLHLWAAKLPSVLLGLVGLPVFYALGSALFGSRLVAFLSTIMMATSWPYFWAAHSATPDIAYTVLLMTLFAMFMRWLHLAAKPKLYQADKEVLSLCMGLCLGLLFLTQGGGGLVAPLLVMLLTLLVCGQLDRLPGLEWKRFAGSFLALSLTWVLWGSISQGNPLFFLEFFAARSLEAGAFSASALSYLRHLYIELFPWNLFLLAALVDKKGLAKMLHVDRNSTIFLVLWLFIGGIGALLSGATGTLTFLTVLPPFFLIVAHYLSNIAGSTLPYEVATDTAILVLLVMAVAITVVVFQYLPDDYLGAVWMLPGPAVISKLELGKHIDLPNLFPVWKLWLLPGPFLLLGGALYLFFLSRTEHSHEIPMAMVVLNGLFLVFLTLCVIPILNRPYGTQFAQTMSRQLLIAPHSHDPSVAAVPSVVIFPNQDYQLLRVPFLMEERATFGQRSPQTHIITDPERVKAALSGPLDTLPRFALVDEQTYYRLSPKARSNYRVLEHHWKWCPASPASMACWIPRMKKTKTYGLQTEVLLLESLTPAIRYP